MLHTIRMQVVHERDVRHMSLYQEMPGGIFGTSIYLLNTELLKQQFGGIIPATITINITAEEGK